ncbi:flagellar biosynthesis protein FlhF [Aminivibrio sp.]|uniref:flagellar biosynthesis protein FlhF n=1 Tax=Aminivibrio sp. TaxID=1872489 RepID=UPI0025C00053|nr:flagellar biosynthesis protein FlhF [Aminivibrio sp.]
MAIKIKRGTQITFEAKDDAEALRTVRDRLGPDAVILSSRRVKAGGFLGLFRRTVLQVSAAVLEEERRSESDAEKKERLAAFQKLLEIKQAMVSPGEGVTGNEASALDGETFRGDRTLSAAGVYSLRPQKVKKEVLPQDGTPDGVEFSRQGLALASEKTPPPAGPPETVSPEKLQNEVNEIARRLDLVLKRLETERSEPAPPPLPSDGGKDILAKLLAAEVSETHARSLVERFRDDPGGKDFAQWLSKKIPVAAQESWEALGGRKVMLIGPTGVGKTTTIAKLAAIHSLWKKKKVFLLTADTYRIAAVKQVETYSKILGIPMDVVDDPKLIGPVLEKTGESDLVLLDTAGRSQRDGVRIEEMRELYLAYQPDAVHLVLAANMKYRDMLDVVKRMGVVPVSRVIFTKTDETTTYGPLLNILLDFDRPVSFITTGQNVPNDIEVASGVRLAEMLLGEERGTSGA